MGPHDWFAIVVSALSIWLSLYTLGSVNGSARYWRERERDWERRNTKGARDAGG